MKALTGDGWVVAGSDQKFLTYYCRDYDDHFDNAVSTARAIAAPSTMDECEVPE